MTERTLLDLAALQTRYLDDIGVSIAELRAHPDAGRSADHARVLELCEALQRDMGAIARLLLLSRPSRGQG